MSKLFRTIGVGANQQTEEVTNEKIRYYKSESDLDSDLANISDDEVIFTQEGNDDRCGIPLGTKLAIQSNAVPYGYLPCNGVVFDENQYPALYAMLGDNHTPVEGHTLDWDNAESITLSTSDYVIQKNGWIVGFGVGQSRGEILINGVVVARYENASTYNYTADIQIKVKKGDVIKSTYNILSADQNFHLVPYKYYKVIKATSGLTTEQQDYVLQSLLEADSYSTEEVATGKKWIDGKPIYRKVCLNCTTSGSADSWNNLGVTISGIDKIISHTAINPTDNVSCNLFLLKALSNGTIQYWCWSSIPMNNGLTTTFILEYTKAD